MKNFLIITLFLNAFIFSCKVEELKTPPVVKTNSSSEIAATSAKIWGEVVEEGSSAATERGFVYSDKNPSPSTSDTKVVSGFGKGEFNVVISNLLPKTKYYFKAYASNQSGIAYGDAKDFTTIDDIKLPTLTTNPIGNISFGGCTTGGTITSDGGGTILEKGIVYGTSANPTISNNKVVSSGTNSYSIDLSGLSDNTTYYIRAFATNSKGTNYGDQQVLTTLKNLTSIIKNGLVAYYPFNGNANDASGSSNNGTVYGAQLTTDRFGNSNKSYNFNGTSDYIVAKTPSINNILSVSFWVNEIDQKVTSNSINPRYISAETCNGGFAIWKNILDSPKGLSFTTNRGGNDYFSNLITNKNTWQLITIVFNGNTCLFYINDKLVGTLNGTSTIQKGENLFIAKSGCSFSGISDFFSGKIDDVGIWNRVLTAEEIKFLYDNDFKP